MKKGLIKSLSIGIGLVFIDLLMLFILVSTDFTQWNLIYLGLAIFVEIAIVGGIVIYDNNKKERRSMILCLTRYIHIIQEKNET